MPHTRNILFICSRNKWRSPTAENIYRRHPHLAVRSRGTSKKAVRHVSEKDIQWANLIIVMERKHAQRLQSEHQDTVQGKELHVLKIQDFYQFMDTNLITRIETLVDLILKTESP